MRKMAMKFPYINFYFVCIIVLVLMPFSQGTVYAQDEYPREYTNPNDIIAFDKSTSYVEAMEVINQFLQENRNKFIIDQSGTGGTIGVNLPAMHWEDALTFILRIKSLGIKEFEDYIEIIPLAELEQERTGAQPQPAAANNPNSTVGDINLQTREVRINATFFEGNKRALQEIGIDWSSLTNNVPDNINDIVTGDGIDPGLGVPQGVNFNDQFVSVNSFNASSVSQNVFNALVNLGEVGPGIRVQALFSAFEADNLGEVIATPFTKVVDGKQGRIQVGQDFSIKQRDIAGNVTDQFFSTGTILTVTPKVVSFSDTNFVHLQISVERSTALPDAVSTIINKQTANTEALLLNGEATAIAGLYRTEENKVRRGIPILKDLPPWFFGLRYLFGYNSNDFVENELIIIVQAELVKSLEDRLKERTFSTQREILNETKQLQRTTLDKVFENSVAPPILIPEDTLEEEEIPLAMATDSIKTPPLEDDSEMIVEDVQEDIPINNIPDATEDELTEEQKQLAEELSLPVDNPELMVVVPKVFSLDEYLAKKENGEEITDETSSNLKFFVIGGSFIVQSNANRFQEDLEDQGYDTRILFHPESRFNFVAYKGFTDFDDAANYLRSIRSDTNSEAWLFTKPNN